MLTTDEPLTQIAVACGLCDQAHFSKLLRRVVDASMNAWRRQHRVGPPGRAAKTMLSRRLHSAGTGGAFYSRAVKVALTLATVAMLTSYQPSVGAAFVHQTQTPYFVSDEDKFLNSVMVRAYNSGDTESLQELLQYWQDTHTPAI